MGTALPGQRVFAIINGMTFAETAADLDGRFRLFFDDPPPPMLNDWEFIAEAPDGTVSGAFEARTNDDPQSQPTVNIIAPVDGIRLNHNSDVDLTSTGVQINIEVELLNGAELDQTQIIVNRGSASAQTYALSNSTTQAVTLRDGSNTIEAQSVSDDGRPARPASVSVTLDATIPDAPILFIPTDNSRTPRSQVTVIGQTHANATVLVRDGTSIANRVTSDAFGNFGVTIQLSEGPHRLSAEVIGNTGLVSASSNSVRIAVEKLTMPKVFDRTDWMISRSSSRPDTEILPWIRVV